ncbi:MAG: YfiR family protein [Bacteroidetes bacterium]|nr:MAG: YfiR family protein [Bacteroidota bacterium]
MKSDEQVEEYTAKAAFVYHFTKFVHWPEYDHPEFKITVFSESPIIEPLKKIAKNKYTQDKKIKVLVGLENYSADCQVLFVPKDVSVSKVNEIVEFYSNKPTLIISERRGMLEQGVDINLLVRKNKIRFEINTQSLKTSGLNASSQLLKLAVNK